jgi:hypothetical protein
MLRIFSSIYHAEEASYYMANDSSMETKLGRRAEQGMCCIPFCLSNINIAIYYSRR